MKRLLTSSYILLLLAISIFGQQRGLSVAKQSDNAPEKRIALVIGNSAYEQSPLINPINDAKDMAQMLTKLGFDIIYKENVTQIEMKRAIRAFGENIRNGGIGLFYYAGHGIQVNGQNYLIPVNATINKEEEIEYEAVDVGFLLAQMESAKNPMNIVILDACRNNPFARSFRSATRGLASITAPSGTLIAYATAPGSVASDGNERNGLYTQELLRSMQAPRVTIEEVFKRVRVAVRDKTQGKQVPWESSSLIGDFYFLDAKDAAKAVTSQTNVPTLDPSAVELSFWETIKNSNNPNDFKAYLQQYPNGRFAALAKIRANLESSEKQTESNTSSEKANTTASIVGNWNIKVESPSGTNTSLLIIKQEDGKLTGLIKSSRGERLFSSIIVKGEEITLVMPIQFQGTDMVITYKGRINKDSMKGVADFGGFAEGEWSAVRN